MKKVLLGMSGGVDSSVCAAILKEQGYDVTGITIKMCPDNYAAFSGSDFLNDVNDAKKVADKLHVNHITADFSDIFSDKVINNFISEYNSGRTPNPCIVCNKNLKFGAMFEFAQSHGFDFIATGHYANIMYDETLKRWLLKKSNSKKDQSYVLYNLTQNQLAHTLFPVSQLEKSDVRSIAKKYNLDISEKPDSQDICFIKNNSYINFLNKYSSNLSIPGDFVDETGNVIGKHNGIVNYTIGQRKGLGVSFGEPMYVTKINAPQNTVVLGKEGTQYSSSLIAKNLNFIPFDFPGNEISVLAKVRYQAKPAKSILIPISKNEVKVVFDSPQRSITPGQSVVFYDENDFVIGGGIID